MKFRILTSALSDGLTVAGRAINNSASLPVLSNVLIEAKIDSEGKSYLAVAGTDLEIALRTRVDAKVDAAGSITVPARLLSNLTATWKQEAVTEAVLDKERQVLNLECDGATAQVKGITPDEYPMIALPTEANWANVGLDPYKLRQTLDRVTFAAATDESRPILTGVYAHAKADEIHFAAADGFRMSTVTMEANTEGVEEIKQGVIIPASALRELARLLPGAGETVRMCFKPGQLAQVAFVLYDRDGQAETILTTQLIQGNFPDYRQIIPKSRALRVTADTHALRRAVEGAMVFAAYSVNIVRWDVQGNREGQQDKLVVSGQSSEMGEQDARVDVHTDGEMDLKGDEDPYRLGQIAVNGKYVLDALRVMNEPQLTLDLTTPSSPLVLSPAGDDSMTTVIMPMHLES